MQGVDTLTITVDSVSTTQINGQDFKTLHVTYFKNNENVPEMYSSTIIEKIGDVNYMFNWHPSSDVICDGNYTTGLRCYQDADIGLYSTGAVECDYIYIWTGIDDVKSSDRIGLSPNPAQDLVEIEAEGCLSYSIELFDLNGRLLKSANAFDSRFMLDLSSIRDGVYVILLHKGNQLIGYKKLIKE